MGEPIDVLTEDGAVTGAVIEKAEAHRTGTWHRAAHLWIVQSDGRVLLQRRALAKENFPGKWDVSVAGHVGAGESAEAAAIREAREELGLELEGLQHLGTLPEQSVLNNGTYIDNEIHEIFLVRRDFDLSELKLDPSEVAAVALVSLDELDSYDLVPHPGEYALFRSIV